MQLMTGSMVSIENGNIKKAIEESLANCKKHGLTHVNAAQLPPEITPEWVELLGDIQITVVTQKAPPKHLMIGVLHNN